MDILMPQLGETVTEGKIISWSRAVGDTVKPGDVLFEIETDKATMEVPAVSAGAITDIRVQAGEVAPVGAVVAVVTGAGEQAPPPKAASPAAIAIAPPTVSIASPSAPPAPQIVKRELDPFNAVRTPERNFGPAILPGGVRVTPLARRLAVQAGLNVAEVKGSGPNGRIVAEDVRRAEAAGRSATVPAHSGATADQVRALYPHTPFVEVELDGMRRTIAKRLVESKQTVPHFYLTADIDIDEMLDLRKRINQANPGKLSVNDFVIKAFAQALVLVPAANAVWAEDRILRFATADVGVAVAVEGGLFTPIVRGAEAKSLSTISAEVRDLAERARERKLKPQEYQGGSAAVSNLGMYGVRQFTAIISPPHATILAVGAGSRRPVETADGGVRFTTQMTVTLSCDHRVVDGALGAQLLSEFKDIMENPLRALL
jgi:pyruvate dehydrogenase E2 component (dihydrolipoamide acetyltransferase)